MKQVSEVGSICETRKLRVKYVGNIRCSRYVNGGRMYVGLNVYKDMSI